MQNHGARQELNERQEEGKIITVSHFSFVSFFHGLPVGTGTATCILSSRRLHSRQPDNFSNGATLLGGSLSSQACCWLLSNTWRAHIGAQRLVDAFRHLIGLFAKKRRTCAVESTDSCSNGGDEGQGRTLFLDPLMVRLKRPSVARVSPARHTSVEL